MSAETDIARLVSSFRSSSGAVETCNLLLEIAVKRESLDIQALDKSTIDFKVDGGDSQVFEIPGVVGQFRSMLARIGMIFKNNSEAARNPALLNPVGRLARSRDEDQILGIGVKETSWSPRPGSPLYSLDGVLVAEDQRGCETRLHFKMENSGRKQRLSIARTS